MNPYDPHVASFVVRWDNEIPPHLIPCRPFFLDDTDIIFRHPPSDALAQDGRIVVPGAIEFQTQIHAGLLTDVCDPNEFYKPELRSTHRFRCVYDPEIQRGIKETKAGRKEFLREKQIGAMMKDIEDNRFECPQLMWNLRAEETVWVYVQDRRQLRIYQGVATRPDTNHRHHAIIRLHQRYLRWRAETGSEKMGSYNPKRAYGLMIYTDDFQREAYRFCVYNFLGWRMASTTARYIESKTGSPNIYSRLARELMERSAVLGAANVEILSNQLSKQSGKMLTFGLLVDSLCTAFPDLTEECYADTLDYLVEFIAELGRVRPAEIALLTPAQRQKIRESSVAHHPIVWQAYMQFAAWLREQKETKWKAFLQVLGQPYIYGREGQPRTYDLFSMENPIWAERGLVAPGKRGLPLVVNNQHSKQVAFQMLRLLAATFRAEQAREAAVEYSPSDQPRAGTA
ncbi:MAG TPA: DNA sulfur modification protein DndB [Candidatus Binatia bacterium]|jgi:hypothetical protein|nr:DNA sulfur modification protein DndB [Candidatus Binatia bacterium]